MTHEDAMKIICDNQINGARFSVVRRPLSGGKGSIVRHKATKNHAEETKESYYARLRGIIEAEPETYFMRWKIEISASDSMRFRKECLDPILENLVDWWDEINPSTKQNARPPNYTTPLHWQHPFGVWNPMDNGAESDLDNHLKTGSEVGLQRTDNLFPELN